MSELPTHPSAARGIPAHATDDPALRELFTDLYGDPEPQPDPQPQAQAALPPPRPPAPPDNPTATEPEPEDEAKPDSPTASVPEPAPSATPTAASQPLMTMATQQPPPPPPSFASIIGAASQMPTSLGGRGHVMFADEIAVNAALAVLRILLRESGDATGGYDFKAVDVKGASPELDSEFSVPNPVGTYLGEKGLVVNGETVEAGLNLPRCSGHSPYKFVPSVECAGRALAKLKHHGWTDADIAVAAGEPDMLTMAGKLASLWPNAVWLAKYRRGRKRGR